MKKVKKLKAPFEVGDLVTTAYGYDDTQGVVRQITKIEADLVCGSKFRAWASGGEVCPTCKRGHAKPTVGLDSAWFKKVDKD
jgi:hypothetical protein